MREGAVDDLKVQDVDGVVKSNRLGLARPHLLQHEAPVAGAAVGTFFDAEEISGGEGGERVDFLVLLLLLLLLQEVADALWERRGGGEVVRDAGVDPVVVVARGVALEGEGEVGT